MKPYVAIIEVPKSDAEAFSVIVPDIQGCFSAGDTLEEAISNAKEAIIMQLEDILERGGQVPEPAPASEFVPKKKKANEMYYLIEVDPRHISTKAQRINITMPEGVLAMVDEAAKKNHQNRSAFLTDAALDKVRSGN